VVMCYRGSMPVHAKFIMARTFTLRLESVCSVILAHTCIASSCHLSIISRLLLIQQSNVTYRPEPAANNCVDETMEQLQSS
jgi:hypothetical protein